MQVKLLRLIQEKCVRPVGEAREQPVDVRILSATHKNLAELVAQGRFREDLFYRINVIELRVPALRERATDIPDLAEAVLVRLSRRMQIATPELALDALERLLGYGFPGNVRELENVLERAMTLCSGGRITAADIQLRAATRPPLAVAQATGPLPLTAPLTGSTASSAEAPRALPDALGEQLEHIERAAIVKALEQTRYNKTAAAKLLGMTFRALRYRIKKLGIE
jgi:two-component system response regulator PilR (NtrC family)